MRGINGSIEQSMDQTNDRSLGGVVAEMGQNLDCVVRLGSGELVTARIPKKTARQMFRVVPGNRVLIEQRGSDEYVVLGFDRS